MSETAKILPFPARPGCKGVCTSDARRVAEDYLTKPRTLESADLDTYLREPDVLLAICTRLKEMRDASPSSVCEQATLIHQWIVEEKGSVGYFDEREYFLGETALIVGSCLRLLGKRDEVDLWLERADSFFRHTLNAGPQLANVAYARLTLHYDMGRYQRVLELLPSLMTSFERFGMPRELSKCRFLEASTLKASGRIIEALARLESLRENVGHTGEPTLQRLVLVTLGEVLAANGRPAEALALYQEALALESTSRQPLAIAHLKAAVGELLREQGSLSAAVESYRAATQDYVSLGMKTMAAYLRVVLSETLLALDRNREAEWEILAALPTIEEEKMVPEGFAATALLGESVRRRRTDSNALRELREHLKANT
jgi:tetratricopeptide (TPR) repeat protein